MQTASAPRAHVTAAAVALAAVVTTAVLALGVSQGWASGGPVELLLAVALIVVAVCIGWIVLQVLIVLLERAGTSLVAPPRPFGLERILVLMELQALEREGDAAASPPRRTPVREEPRASEHPSGGTVAG